jgi:hypothetical protein
MEYQMAVSDLELMQSGENSSHAQQTKRNGRPFHSNDYEPGTMSSNRRVTD